MINSSKCILLWFLVNCVPNVSFALERVSASGDNSVLHVLHRLKKDIQPSKNSNQFHQGKRRAWEFEQDDIFINYATAAPTITNPPTASQAPSDHPTSSMAPTYKPSSHPTSEPTDTPSANPSTKPSTQPSSAPSSIPTASPTKEPSYVPTATPSYSPSAHPSTRPSSIPTEIPSVIPTESPTAQPSKLHSSKPSMGPSVFRSDHPSQAPSVFPSDHPSQAPSVFPSAKPSPQPSAYPTISNAPSSSPTISSAPSVVISNTHINKFTVVLTSPPNSPTIDSYVFIDVVESFLDDYLKKNLPKSLKYREVKLKLATSKGRRLQRVTTITLKGEARFNLFSSPDIGMINNYVIEAFSKSDETFFDVLKNSQNAGLQSILGVKTNEDTKAHNAFNTVHLTIILGCASIVIVGVAASYIWKRNQQHNVRKRLLRAAEHNARQHQGQPQLDDDCFRDISPEPIQICDDGKALERMIMRARHDRGVMNRANDLLLQQAEYSQQTSNPSVRFAPIIQKISHDNVVQRDSYSTEDDLYDQVISPCSNGSSITQLSREGSIATDLSGSLVTLGFNGIETSGRQNHIDLHTDDTYLTHSTKNNTRGTSKVINDTKSAKQHSDGNAYFTSQQNRLY